MNGGFSAESISPFGRNDTECHFAPWRLGAINCLAVVLSNISEVRIYG